MALRNPSTLTILLAVTLVIVIAVTIVVIAIVIVDAPQEVPERLLRYQSPLPSGRRVRETDVNVILTSHEGL